MSGALPATAGSASSLAGSKHGRMYDDDEDVKPDVSKRAKLELDEAGSDGEVERGLVPSAARWPPSQPRLASGAGRDQGRTGALATASALAVHPTELTASTPPILSDHSISRFPLRSPTPQPYPFSSDRKRPTGMSQAPEPAGQPVAGSSRAACEWRGSDHATLSQSLLALPNFPNITQANVNSVLARIGKQPDRLAQLTINNFLKAAPTRPAHPPSGSKPQPAPRLRAQNSPPPEANTSGWAPWTKAEHDKLWRLHDKLISQHNLSLYDTIARHFPGRTPMALRSHLSKKNRVWQDRKTPGRQPGVPQAGPWGAEDKRRLRQAFKAATAGGGWPDWEALAAQFPGRTPVALEGCCRHKLKLFRHKPKARAAPSQASVLSSGMHAGPVTASLEDNIKSESDVEPVNAEAEESRSGPNTSRSAGTPWTEEDHAKLIKLRDRFRLPNGKPDWDRIATHFEGRTPSACSTRLCHTDEFRYGKLTSALNAAPALRSSPSARRLARWNAARAKPVTVRSGGQPWTQEESERLWAAYSAAAGETDQARFDVVAPQHPGRTREGCVSQILKLKREKQLSAGEEARRRRIEALTAKVEARAGAVAAAAAATSSQLPLTGEPASSPALPVQTQAVAVQPASPLPPPRAAVQPPAHYATPVATPTPVPAPTPTSVATPTPPEWTEADKELLLDVVGVCEDPKKVTTAEWVGIASALGKTKFECVVQYRKLQRAG